jgi:hypothetical protein
MFMALVRDETISFSAIEETVSSTWIVYNITSEVLDFGTLAD